MAASPHTTRPPYYHPPRSRPVAFERPTTTTTMATPSEDSLLHLTSDRPIQVVYVKHHHHHHHQRQANPLEANGNPNPQPYRHAQNQQQQQQLGQSRSSGQEDRRELVAAAAAGEEVESSKMLAGRQAYYYAPREACGRLEPQPQQQQQQQQQQHQYQLSDWPSHNSSPRPYVRAASEGRERAAPSARLAVGVGGGAGGGVAWATSAESAAGASYGESQRLPYPTSTVHKSMLRWAPPALAQQPQQPAYSRLITPAGATSLIGGGGGVLPEAPAHSAEPVWSGACGSGSGTSTGSAGQENYAPGARAGSQPKSREEPASRRSPAQVGAGDWPARRLWTPGAGAGGSRAPSNTLAPDTKRDQCERLKQLERGQIAHQTYRTLPIVLAGPKTRHDLPAGTYMHLNRDPSWELATQSSRRGQRQRQRWLELELPAAPAPATRTTTTSTMANVAQANISLPLSAQRPGGALAAEPSQQAHQEQQQQRQPLPAFDYRQYIESTRRAH